MTTENKRMIQAVGTAAQWKSSNPTLSSGELGVISDLNAVILGNGSFTASGHTPVTIGNLVVTEVPSSPVTADIYDTVKMLTNGTTASFTYNLPSISSVGVGWSTPYFGTTQAGVITLTPQAGQAIDTKSNGVSLTCSSAVGNVCRLIAASSSKWLFIAKHGTWS